jgi:hypothetical protein
MLAYSFCKGKLFIALIFTASALLLMSCSGKEIIKVDKIPPGQVALIPHLGDTGDSVNGQRRLNDSNNGIDAVPDSDWLRIEWQPILDPDVNHIKIFRYGDYSPVTEIDQLSRNQWIKNEYIDKSLSAESPVGQEWFYYVESWDLAGNFAVSDTVSYKLTEKPELVSPANNAVMSHNETITFAWRETQDALHYRVLVFDSDNKYIWHGDYFDVEESDYTLKYRGPDLSIYDAIIWRVDAFGDLVNEQGVSISGSESLERVLFLNN